MVLWQKKKIGKVMAEYEHGSLKMGKRGKPVRNRKQVIAIGLSEARAREEKILAFC